MAAGDDMPTFADLRRGKNKRATKQSPAEKRFESPGLFDAPSIEIEPERTVRSVPLAERSASPVEAKAEPKVWSVAALVQNVRGLVERSYGQITVEGEISNWRPAASGHCYFTLKDGDAQLSIVMFRRQAQLLRFKPKDGDAVRLRGQLSVYESRGQMQLIAETMEQVGLGALLAATRELKEKLRREGLFEHKRPLPEFPRCIGVVTSAQGAALRDIVKVCRRRHAAVRLLVYHAAVQGPNCPTEIAAGVRWFSTHPSMADVVIVARGGGSWEDLHGFDAEVVARAIAECSVPVIAGIGHAVDSTIADAAADVCAPTPSAAAELVTASHFGLAERVARLSERLRRAGRYELMHARQQFARLSAEVVLRRVQDGLGRREQRLDELAFRAESAVLRSMRQRREHLVKIESRVRQQHASLRLAEDTQKLQSLAARLSASRLVRVTDGHSRWQRLSTQLEALSPLRVLERGYALVYGPDGKLLRSSDDVDTGDRMTAQLARGRVRATVTGTE
jgi:exodeoxyribonuclease VII large subunit